MAGPVCEVGIRALVRAFAVRARNFFYQVTMKNPLSGAVWFVLGAMAMLFLGKSTSVFSQMSPAQTLLIDVQGAAPVVSTRPLIAANQMVANGSDYALKLDGIDCTDCEVTDGGVIQYWGGPFKLTKLRRSGVITMELKGAAWNTEFLLASFGLIGCPVDRPKPVGPYAPTLHTASLRSETIKALVSPVGTK